MPILWRSLTAVLVFAGAASGFDVIHIDGELDNDHRIITGRMEVSFRSIVEPLDDLRFRLYPNLTCATDTCGISVDSLLVNGANLSDRVEIEKTDMYIRLPGPLKSPVDATVFFRTKVPAQQERFGYFDDHYCLETWFPMPAPRVDSQWQRVVYNAQAEPAADFYDFVVNFKVPDSLTTIAPGLVSADTFEKSVTSRYEQSAVHEFSMIIGTGYEADTMQSGDISLKVYYRERDSFAVDTTIALADSALKLMSRYVVTYPYDEFNVVLGGFYGGGLEVPLGAFVDHPPRVSVWRGFEVMLIHEIVHQWFYGIINSNQADAPWLDESIAEYFTWKILADLQGGEDYILSTAGFTETFTGTNRFLARQYIGLLPITEAASYYSADEYYVTVYYKGFLVLKTFAALLGVENEPRFWSAYGDAYQMERPTTADFFEMAGRFLGGPASAEAIIGMDEPLDFEMRSIKRQVVDTLDMDSAGTEPGPVAGPVVRSTVDFMARHPLGLPVTLRIVFQDDAQRDTILVPRPGRNSIVVEYVEPVKGAIIDPDYVYAVDINLLNNALYPDASEGAGLRLFSGLTYLVELLFGLAWGI